MQRLNEEYDDDDILPEARIFEYRADNIMQTKMQAYEDLCKKIEKEQEEEALENEQNELLMKVKDKLKRKTRGRKGKVAPDPDDEKDVTPPKAARRRGRRKCDEEEGVPEVKGKTKANPTTPVNLPAGIKKKLKELEIKTSRENQRMDEECNRILSSCDATSLEEEGRDLADIPLEQTLTLNIRYLSEISKIKVTENESFSVLFPKIAKLYNLKASEMLLYKDDTNIELTDTPLSLKLKFFDVIDCIPYKPVEHTKSQSDVNKLLIKFQSNDTKKRTDMHTHKLEKFGDVMQRYADLRNLALSNLVFEFDGEKILSSETPEDLDMESGSCVDVKVLNFSNKRTKSVKRAKVIEVYDDIPASEMLDICVLD